MLSSSEQYIHEHNAEARPILYGQDWNDEAYAICKSDMLIKGEDADNVKLGDTFSNDGFPDKTFDYMLANPPFGVSWKQQERFIKRERDSLGYDGRFGAGLPRVNDGALLFLQHMIPNPGVYCAYAKEIRAVESCEYGRVGASLQAGPRFGGTLPPSDRVAA